jgi:hypothetical protein
MHMARCLALACVALAAALLTGCSAVQFSYNHAEGLLRYKLNDYVDLDESQTEAFKQRLGRVQDWHRGNELPLYVAFLQSARDRFVRGATRADLDWALVELRKRYRIAIARAATDAAPLLATLSDDQLRSIEKGLARDESKFRREWLSGNPARRERYVAERLIDRIEEWTGDLNDAQRAQVGAFVRAHPGLNELRIQERRRWQKEALELVRQHRGKPAELAPKLAALFSDPDARRSDQYNREMRRYESDLCDLLLALERTLDSEQRARALGRIDRYAEDFRALTRGAIAMEPRERGS